MPHASPPESGVLTFSRGARSIAAAFVALFILLALLRIWTASNVIVPLLIVHGILLCNTYFSLRIFLSIQPRSKVVSLLDGVLVLAYCFMTYVLGDAFLYPLAFAMMFTISMLKYATLLGMTPHVTLLRHKVQMQAFGALSAMVAVIIGREASMASFILWLWAIGFGAAQIDIFFLRPLYRFRRED